ncbi:MAG TPA: tetratricopeptide repeat protein, partial [Spirochaetia bacterium]|nr:tetratricopeptide repeat protein [Spirochaetia bacterium]
MLSLFRRDAAQHFATSFHWLEERPLPERTERFYSTRYQRGAYSLTLAKDSYFAWETLSAARSYDDFVLEADLEIDPSNGHSAVGVVFRHVTDENFYSFLISSRGNFRFDLLFNNHPAHLVEWTPLAEPEAGRRRLSVIARGPRFTFLVDEEWIAELDDEVLPSGGIGFAAQNFAGSGPGIFRLCRLSLEARPLIVERDHLRWHSFLPVSPASRLRLAETLCAMGSYEAAAVQLRRALREREGTVRERFLLAECYAHLSLYPEALAELDQVQKREPGHREARIERANLLYLTNQLDKAREAISAAVADPQGTAGPAHWNLLGNVEYALGNWQRAADAYLRAVELDPKMSLFLSNAARALERAGRAPDATDAYLRAARLLFAEESFDELSTVMPRLTALAPHIAEVRALEAKMLYREGKADEAFRILSELDAHGSRDASVHYLLGIMLNERGRREAALPHLLRAAELEPDFPLNQFRLAETLHLLGEDCGPALERALELAPRDPWTNNLAGMLRMEAGDFGRAAAHLRVAQEAAPEEREIAVNLSEALSLSGDHAQALTVLDDFASRVADSARVANQRGNILGRLGEHARAVREYETAIRLDPQDWHVKENCAAACLQLDMVHRAEELLAQIEPEHPSASVYNLLGNVAVLKGETARGEVAYRTGLELDPENRDLSV